MDTRSTTEFEGTVTTRIELEVSLSWIQDNPYFFRDSFTRFLEESKSNGLNKTWIETKSEGFVTFISTREE